MWIDAICINQADITERGHQVGMMKDIYEGRHVRVWLGNSDHDSTLEGLEVLRTLHDWHNDPEELPVDLSYQDCESWTRRVEALSRLFRLPYWNRMWIVQEVALAATTTVVCRQSGVQMSDWYNLWGNNAEWHDLVDIEYEKPQTHVRLMPYEELLWEFVSIDLVLQLIGRANFLAVEGSYEKDGKAKVLFPVEVAYRLANVSGIRSTRQDLCDS